MAPVTHLLLFQLFLHYLHHVLLGDMEHTQVAEPGGESDSAGILRAPGLEPLA